MSTKKNQEVNSLNEYIKSVENQEIKVFLLKLKNEIKKEDVTWEKIKDILSIINQKNNGVLYDIIPYLLD